VLKGCFKQIKIRGKWMIGKNIDDFYKLWHQSILNEVECDALFYALKR
jgi:hypothetical protein